MFYSEKCGLLEMLKIQSSIRQLLLLCWLSLPNFSDYKKWQMLGKLTAGLSQLAKSMLENFSLLKANLLRKQD